MRTNATWKATAYNIFMRIMTTLFMWTVVPIALWLWDRLKKFCHMVADQLTSWSARLVSLAIVICVVYTLATYMCWLVYFDKLWTIFNFWGGIISGGQTAATAVYSWTWPVIGWMPSVGSIFTNTPAHAKRPNISMQTTAEKDSSTKYTTVNPPKEEKPLPDAPIDVQMEDKHSQNANQELAAEVINTGESPKEEEENKPGNNSNDNVNAHDEPQDGYDNVAEGDTDDQEDDIFSVKSCAVLVLTFMVLYSASSFSEWTGSVAKQHGFCGSYRTSVGSSKSKCFSGQHRVSVPVMAFCLFLCAILFSHLNIED